VHARGRPAKGGSEILKTAKQTGFDNAKFPDAYLAAATSKGAKAATPFAP